MSTIQEIKLDEQWAAAEFADVELKDARLNRRCQELAVALGQQPMVPINQACEDWADTKAAYRFFGNSKKVTPAGISASHHQRTVERMSQYGLVLALQEPPFSTTPIILRRKGWVRSGTKSNSNAVLACILRWW